MKKQIDKEFADIDAALRRAAITAKTLADKNGVSYVVLQDNEAKTTYREKEHTKETK